MRSLTPGVPAAPLSREEAGTFFAMYLHGAGFLRTLCQSRPPEHKNGTSRSINKSEPYC
jgi:hypothetical protein